MADETRDYPGTGGMEQPVEPDGMDFDAEAEEHEAPCRFKLGGRWWTCRHQEEIPFSVLGNLLENGSDTPKFAQVQVRAFFEAVLDRDEFDDFDALMRAKDSPLTTGNAPKIMNFVSEKVFGRPTTPPRPSRNGRQSTRV